MVNQLDLSEVTLEILAIQGRNLPNKDFFKKQDPFLQFELGYLSQRTKVDKNGGTRPEWNSRVRFERLRCPVEQTLKVICYDSEWKRKEQFIGECTIDISSIFSTGEDDGWFKLNDRGADAGEIYLELTFFSQDGFSKLSSLYASNNSAPVGPVVTLPTKIVPGTSPLPPSKPISVVTNSLQSSSQVSSQVPSKSSLNIPHKPSGSAGSENSFMLACSDSSASSQIHNYSNSPGSKPLPSISDQEPGTSYLTLSEEPSSIVSNVDSTQTKPTSSQLGSTSTPSNSPPDSHGPLKAPEATGFLPGSGSAPSSNKESKKPFTIASFVPLPPIRSDSTDSSKPQDASAKVSLTHNLEKLNLDSHSANSSAHHSSLDSTLQLNAAANSTTSTSSTSPSNIQTHVPLSGSSQVAVSQDIPNPSGFDENLKSNLTPGYYSNNPHLNAKQTNSVNSNDPMQNNTTELIDVMNALEATGLGYLPNQEVPFPPPTKIQSSHNKPVGVSSNPVVPSSNHSVTPVVTPVVDLNKLPIKQSTPTGTPTGTPPVEPSEEPPTTVHPAPVASTTPNSLTNNQVLPTATPSAGPTQSVSSSIHSLPAEQLSSPAASNLPGPVKVSPYQSPPSTVPLHQAASLAVTSTQPALPPRPLPTTLQNAAGGGFVYQFLPPGAPFNSGPPPPLNGPPLSGGTINHFPNPPMFPSPLPGNSGHFSSQPPGGSGFHFSPPKNNNFPVFPNHQNYMPVPQTGYVAPFNSHGPSHMPNFPTHNSWGHSGPPSNPMLYNHPPPPPIPIKPSHMPSNYGQNIPPPLPSRPSSSLPNQHGFPMSPTMHGPPVLQNTGPGPNIGYSGNQMSGPSHHQNSIPVLNHNNFQPPSTPPQPTSSVGKKKKKNKLGFLFS